MTAKDIVRNIFKLGAVIAASLYSIILGPV